MDLSKYTKKQTVMGKEMSYFDLKEWDTIKTFRNTNHNTDSLVKDADGNLWYYHFHEEMSFSGPDIINELWFKVPSAEFAEENWNKDIFFWRSQGFLTLHVGPGGANITVMNYSEKI